jgi:hypothetical protein
MDITERKTMKTKLISIELIPHPKQPDRFRLTITWMTEEGMLVSDEFNPMFLQSAENHIKDFRIKHPHL